MIKTLPHLPRILAAPNAVIPFNGQPKQKKSGKEITPNAVHIGII